MSKTNRIIDLCSGGAMPIFTVYEKLSSGSRIIPIVISDKYPNVSAFEQIEQASDGGISPVYEPVDAVNVPSDLSGFRTIFTSFHHFNSHEGTKILSDAVKRKQGVGVFEYTERKFKIWAPILFFMPFYVLCITPFIRPFSWERLFWTYCVPIIPIALAWDGFVSCLRSYSPPELDEMLRRLPAGQYAWQIGRVRYMYLVRVTYLIGFPLDHGDHLPGSFNGFTDSQPSFR